MKLQQQSKADTKNTPIHSLLAQHPHHPPTHATTPPSSTRKQLSAGYNPSFPAQYNGGKEEVSFLSKASQPIDQSAVVSLPGWAKNLYVEFLMLKCLSNQLADCHKVTKLMPEPLLHSRWHWYRFSVLCGKQKHNKPRSTMKSQNLPPAVLFTPVMRGMA